MDPMHAALSRRRSKHLDQSLVSNADGIGKDALPEHSDTKGDLAPETTGGGPDDGPSHMAAERKAMHASMGHDLKDAVHTHELSNPEHEPIARGGMNMDPLGHESLSQDAGFEHMMQGAHNPSLQKPKTLTARVAAAMHSKGKA